MSSGPNTNHFVGLIQNQVGEEFVIMANVSLWQMRLIVLVHQAHKDDVTALEHTTEATGIGHVLGGQRLT